MKSLRKVVGDLIGQSNVKTGRKRRPGRARLGSLVERLEARSMLSQVNLGAAIVVPPPVASGPAIIRSTQAPSLDVDTSVPVGAAGDAGALDVTEGGGQIGVQLVRVFGSRLSTGAAKS